MTENVELFTQNHCKGLPYQQPLHGLVLTLNSEILVEADCKPENQLYMCVDDRFDPPDYSQHPIHVISLGDGEKYSWDIEDFIGVLKEDFLPEWAEQIREKAPKKLSYEEKIYHQGKELPFEMPLPSKLISKYNESLLIARKTEMGLDFVTYQYDNDRQGVHTGRYFEDFQEARSDFALRSGLIPTDEMFTKEEKQALGDACRYVIDVGEYTHENEEFLHDVLNKIDYDLMIEEREAQEEDYDR